MCVYEGLCVCECRYLWRLVASDPLRVTGVVSFLVCVLRAELESSRRAVSTPVQPSLQPL